MCIIIAPETSLNIIHVGVVLESQIKVSASHIKRIFPEFPCSIKFYKGIGNLFLFLVGKNNEPQVINFKSHFSLSMVQQVAALCGKHKKIPFELLNPPLALPHTSGSVLTVRKEQRAFQGNKGPKGAVTHEISSTQKVPKPNKMGIYFLNRWERIPIDWFFIFLRGVPFYILFYIIVYFRNKDPTFDFLNWMVDLENNYVKILFEDGGCFPEIEKEPTIPVAGIVLILVFCGAAACTWLFTKDP